MILNQEIYDRIAPDSDRIRNVCILGHVDHGKTTLADNILGYNKVISGNSVGDALFMDYRNDERERGITMKSSCFSSLYVDKLTKLGYIINFVDSPGHIDFVNEINIATNLADSAIIIVDVIEGLKSQTKEVIKQCIKKGLTMILVLNKIDRCFNLYKHDSGTLEMFQTIKYCLEDINSFIASFDQFQTICSGNYFKPTINNVIFSSFRDRWAFTLASVGKKFNEILHFQISENDDLSKYLWDDYCFNSKQKNFKKIKESKTSQTPSFIDVILKPLYNRYNNIIKKDEEYLSKILSKYKIYNFSIEDISQSKAHDILRFIMNFDFPASECILNTIIKCTPAPIFLTEKESPLCSVFKLYPIKSNDLVNYSKNRKLLLEFISNKKIVILCQCKIIGEKISINDPIKFSNNNKLFNVHLILLQFGKTLLPVDEAFSGTLVSLVILPQEDLSSNSFIFSADYCQKPSGSQSTLTLYNSSVSNIPLFQVTIQPKDPNDYQSIKESLKLLASCDESIKTWVDQSTGDLILGTDGEINLQKSINDLREFYSQNIEFSVSEIFIKMKEIIKSSDDSRIYQFLSIVDNLESNIISAKLMPISLYEMVIGEKNLDEILSKVNYWNKSFDINNFEIIKFDNSSDYNILILNKSIPTSLKDNLKTGFLNCCKNGWLASESIVGLGLIISELDASKCFSNSALCTLLLRIMKISMKKQFTINDFRLFWPIFKCHATCSLSQIRDIQNIIEQRYGIIVGEGLESETMNSNYVDMVAELPVFKSLGIFQEIQSQSSGSILPRLEFSHWETLDIDANWKPNDFDDLELYGSCENKVNSSKNISYEVVKSIRKRKGLTTDEVLIKNSNKQRTLTKSK